MRINRLHILFVLLLISMPARAIELTGNAYGETPELARKKALASLSESIFVEVKSSFSSEQKNDGTFNASREILSTSDLPLLGVDFTVVDKVSEQYCIASLDSEKSLKLYQAELARLSAAIKRANSKQQTLTNNKTDRYRLLSALLADIEQYTKYRAVALLLGEETPSALPVTEQDIRTELLSIESAAPSLDIAVEILIRDLPDELYFVQPPLPQGSRRATELSRILKDKIESRVRSVEDISRSEVILKGSYEILDDGLSVTYRAIGPDGATLATRLVRLAGQACKRIDYKPAAIDFDRLLHEGYVVSNDFRAELNSNRGKSDLLFLPGDTVQLFSKLNHPGYLYVVAHNTQDNVSYLLELNHARGKRAFVRYINADDANRWVSLGEFEVTPPYGAESLQLIASSDDLLDKLPATRFDKTTGLYLVQAASMTEAVNLTRALKPKKSAGVKAAEATLTFTTMQKRE